jgi:CheY-like chemotaxis protein
MNKNASKNSLERARRILVVDDEPVVRLVVREALERPDWYLVEAMDGERAIKLLLHEPFDLLICDKNLPGITGLDVIRRAKAVDPKMGTLMITAYASRESAEEALLLGVDGYVIKPFDVQELIAKVKEAFHRREARETFPLPKEQGIDSPRVLVCDPQKESRQHLLSALDRLGVHAVAVSGLSDVLKRIQNQQCDCLICDLEMMNSTEATACFLRSILLVSPSVRFVALSTPSSMAAVIDAMDQGADKVFYRPVSPQKILGELKDFLF